MKAPSIVLGTVTRSYWNKFTPEAGLEQATRKPGLRGMWGYLKTASISTDSTQRASGFLVCPGVLTSPCCPHCSEAFLPFLHPTPGSQPPWSGSCACCGMLSCLSLRRDCYFCDPPPDDSPDLLSFQNQSSHQERKYIK